MDGGGGIKIFILLLLYRVMLFIYITSCGIMLEIYLFVRNEWLLSGVRKGLVM